MNPEDNTNTNPVPEPTNPPMNDTPDLESAAAEVQAAVEEAANSIDNGVGPDATEPTIEAPAEPVAEASETPETPVIDVASPAESVAPEEPAVEEPVEITSVPTEEPAAPVEPETLTPEAPAEPAPVEPVTEAPAAPAPETPAAAPVAPKAKSNAGVIIALTVVLLAIVGVIVYILINS